MVSKVRRTYALADGAIKHGGGDHPLSVPHKCPYLVVGARDEEQCLIFTANYMRNINGCCGVDERGFGPCNSQWRRCRGCVQQGLGKHAALVSDEKSGLCDWHLKHGEGGVYVPPSTPVLPLRLQNLAKPEPPAAPQPATATGAGKPSTSVKLPSIAVTDEEVKVIAQKVRKESQRSQDVLRVASVHTLEDAAVKLRMSEDSLKSRFTNLCTRVGVPISGKAHRVDRAGTVRRAFELLDKAAPK